MSSRSKIIILVLLLVGSTSFGVYAGGIIVKERELRNMSPEERLLHEMDLPDNLGFHETIDQVHNFIYAHTIHNPAEEFYSHWGRQAVIVDKIAAHIDGKRDRVPLECSSRSQLMHMALNTLGFKTRPIVVYKFQDYEWSHMFLEVFNSETERWEAYDPSFQVYWSRAADHGDGIRLSTADIVQYDLETIIPCRSPDECGWDIDGEAIKTIDRYKPYFGVAYTIDTVNKTQPVWVSEERFEVSSVDEMRSSDFCKTLPNLCRGPIYVMRKDGF